MQLASIAVIKVCSCCSVAVDSMDSQIIFVNAPDGEESIELVSNAVENEPSGGAERTDIVEVSIFHCYII